MTSEIDGEGKVEMTKVEHEATARPWQHGYFDTDTGSWLKLHKHGSMHVIRKGKLNIAVFIGDNAGSDAKIATVAVNAHADLVAALEAVEWADTKVPQYSRCPRCGGHDPVQCDLQVPQPCAISENHGHYTENYPPEGVYPCQLDAALGPFRKERAG